MNEIFSYHIVGTNPFSSTREILFAHHEYPGLMHSESLFPMRLGFPVLKPTRYGVSQLVFFARWENEKALDDFMSTTDFGKFLAKGWHARLKFYRRWGSVSELDHLPENSENLRPDLPVVGITLARLKLTETVRFLKWGRPVENLVRDHRGKTFAMAAMRPLNTLSTFSIWKSEKAMLDMVKGDNVHGKAIGEQLRNSFHHEFTTMRFYLLSEHGLRP